ncbi:hypothetical protein RRG08_005324 [Elysia crispata]|uniref:Sodium/nucleoside cotransporter n=1 Tax=Elysia crispata TaxID=231223 RepID=A0AAE0YZZ4_9GAST|nr:hypothetical protein RRG08_005324 [Elysia crispata]
MDIELRSVSAHIDKEKSLQPNTLTSHAIQNGSGSVRLEVPENLSDHDKNSEKSAGNCWVRMVEALEVWTRAFWASYRQVFYTGLKVVMVSLYLAFVSYSWYYHFGDEDSIVLLVITAFLVVRTFGRALRVWGVTSKLARLSDRPLRKLAANLIFVRCSLYPLAALAVGLYLGLEVIPANPQNIQSLIGIFGFIVICFVLSVKPSRVDWHPVFWGFIAQICMAIFTLRTEIGQSVFQWLSDAVQTFTAFSDSGAEFVLGKDFKTMGLLFQAGGMLVFFNSIIFVLLHLGVIGAVVRYGGRTVAFCLGTGPVESVVAVTNIFLGQSEVILLTRPYLPALSLSEFCAVVTCGYASVSGAFIGTFMAYGAPGKHLLTAAVMSAPAALALSKLIMPETSKVDRSAQARGVSMRGDGEDRTVLSACSEGAIAAVGMVAAIMSNMLAFYSILTMFNALLHWVGLRVGIQDLTFETVCGYLLYPLSYMMGVHPDDCFAVGALIGVKMFATPMAGFAELGKLIKNRKDFENYLKTNSTWHKVGTDIFLEATNITLEKGVFQERSEVISTYAMCGFSAFTALAIGLGGLFAVCPERKKDIIKIIPYAFFAGNMACFATGAVAGRLFVSLWAPMVEI